MKRRRRSVRKRNRQRLPASFLESWRGYRWLAARQIIVQGIRLAWRPAVRNLAQGIHDLQRNGVARHAGSAFEQIRHRCAKLRLGIIGAGEIPILLV